MTFLNSDGVKVDAYGKPLSEAKTEGTSDVDTLKQQLASQISEHDKALEEAKKLSEQLKAVQTDTAKQLKEVKAASATEVSTLKTQVTDLTKQLKGAESKPTLPEDARARLISVDGIDEALADKALTALAKK